MRNRGARRSTRGLVGPAFVGLPTSRTAEAPVIAINNDDPLEMSWRPPTFGQRPEGPTPWPDAHPQDQVELNDPAAFDPGSDVPVLPEARAAQVALYAHLAEREEPIDATRGARIADGAAARASMAAIDAPKEWEDARATLDVGPRPEEREVAIEPLTGTADDSVGSAASAAMDFDLLDATRGARIGDGAAARATMAAIDAPKEWEESRATLDPTIGHAEPSEIAMEPLILDRAESAEPNEIAMPPMDIGPGLALESTAMMAEQEGPTDDPISRMVNEAAAAGADLSEFKGPPPSEADTAMVREMIFTEEESASGADSAMTVPEADSGDEISRMVHEAASAGSDLSQFRGAPPPESERGKWLAMME